jgi:DNA-binding winged helix-turn-helix (wHTH) protein
MFTTTERGLAEGPLVAPPASRRYAAPVFAPARPVVYHFGRCEVRPACREVLVDGAKRKLQPRPFDLLVYLIEHRGRVLSIDELLDVIWGAQEVQISSLAAAIARIRSVLDEGKNGSGPIIQTHHRVGYRFVASLEADAAAAA